MEAVCTNYADGGCEYIPFDPFRCDQSMVAEGLSVNRAWTDGTESES